MGIRMSYSIILVAWGSSLKVPELHFWIQVVIDCTSLATILPGPSLHTPCSNRETVW